MGNKRFIKYKELLYYYDRPLMFCVKDNLDCNYLCWLINKENDTYLCIPETQNMLEKFNSHGIDGIQKDIYRNKEYYTCQIHETETDSTILTPHDGPIPEEFLPGLGFFLTM